MKTVYLIRHAKSSWENHDLKDIDRPLNKRGKRDAPFMAKLLQEKGVKPDAIISSPANRAYTTACEFAKAFDIPEEDILQEEAIYEAYASEVLAIIQNQPKHRRTILIFGHNPTFTNLANLFTDDYIDNVPTCGVVKIEAITNNWPSFTDESGNLVEFLYPKQYFK